MRSFAQGVSRQSRQVLGGTESKTESAATQAEENLYVKAWSQYLHSTDGATDTKTVVVYGAVLSFT